MDIIVGPRAALLVELLHGEGHARGLARRIRERTDGAIELGASSLYPALQTLERDGLVVLEHAEPEPGRGGHARVVARLTDEGRARAREHREALRKLVEGPPAGRT